MKYYKLSNGMEISAIALGCMRMYDMSSHEVEGLVEAALNNGINFFDHADIYGGGTCEAVFGKVLKRRPEWRKQMIIQTKCGICNGYYDLSYEHIIESVNASLERLHTDYIDILLLHRPDALMNNREIAKAFNELFESGKVHCFGVSNMNPSQIEYIQKECRYPILFNQLQFNVVNAGMIDAGINVNMNNAASINHDSDVLNYCMNHGITIQPWSILQASWEKGTYLNNPEYSELNTKLSELAKKYNVTPATIAVSWILRHPARMQPIAGTTNKDHLNELCKATSFELSRQEWYDLYRSVNRMLP